MTRSFQSIRWLGLLAIVVAAGSATAQQNPATPAGGQDLAPGGGMTVQAGVATAPTACPDGTSAVESSESSASSMDLSSSSAATDASGSSFEAPSGEFKCPDPQETTTGDGADPSKANDTVAAPAMK